MILKLKEMSILRDKVLMALGTLVGILYFVSMLMQLMHWPGKQVVWLTTLALSFFVVIPIYFFSGYRKPETKVNTIVATILMVAAVGMQFTLTALHANAPKPTDTVEQQTAR